MIAETIILTELELAGIALYWPLPLKQLNPEVYVMSFGQLGDWTFRRFWYYWIAHTESDFKGLELGVAEDLWNDPQAQKEVRAGGDCACRHPSTWANYFDADGYLLCSDPDGSEQKAYERFWSAEGREDRRPPADRRLRFVKDKRDGYARAVVSNYHIDSQWGLGRFADLLRKSGARSGPGGNTR